jgi:uncharacterized OB-fold protein
VTSQRLDRARGRWYASAVSASAPAAPRGRRPIVPFLRLPDAGEPHLVGQRCKPCGAVYLGTRRACSRCTAEGPFEEIPLSRKGTVWVWSIVHQSMPGVPVPYVVGVVDLPEGVAVRCNLIDVEPDPAKLRFGMPVEMTTGVSQQDRDGNDVIAFYFRPTRG